MFSVHCGITRAAAESVGQEQSIEPIAPPTLDAGISGHLRMPSSPRRPGGCRLRERSSRTESAESSLAGISCPAQNASRSGSGRKSPMTVRGGERYPQWYKDAVIYELHVRAFCDGNADGVGDFPGLIEHARLPAGPRRHGALAAAVLPLAAQGRRLRHRRLHGRPPRLRDPGRLQALPRRGAPPRAAGDHRAGPQPHLRPAPLVPARAPCSTRQPRARLLRLE